MGTFHEILLEPFFDHHSVSEQFRGQAWSLYFYQYISPISPWWWHPLGFYLWYKTRSSLNPRALLFDCTQGIFCKNQFFYTPQTRRSKSVSSPLCIDTFLSILLCSFFGSHNNSLSVLFLYLLGIASYNFHTNHLPRILVAT